MPGSPRAQGITTEAQHGARKRNKREGKDRTDRDEARGTTKQRHTPGQPKTRLKTREKDKKERQRRGQEQTHTEQAARQAHERPHYRVRKRPTRRPATSTRAPSNRKPKKERKEKRRMGYNSTPGGSTTTRATEGPRMCVPNYPKHTDHASTI